MPRTVAEMHAQVLARGGATAVHHWVSIPDTALQRSGLGLHAADLDLGLNHHEPPRAPVKTCCSARNDVPWPPNHLKNA